jgi:hypothetical protein
MKTLKSSLCCRHANEANPAVFDTASRIIYHDRLEINMKKLIPLFVLAIALLSCQSTPRKTAAAEDSIPKQKVMFEKGIPKDTDQKTLSMIILTPDLPLHIMKMDGVKQFGLSSAGLTGNVLITPGTRTIGYAYDEYASGSTEFHQYKEVTFDFQPGVSYKVHFTVGELHLFFTVEHEAFLPIE